MRYEDVKPLWGDHKPSSVVKVERGEKRETVISHMQGEELCRIWTNEGWWVNRVCQWAQRRPQEVEFEEFSEQGVTVLVPLSWMQTMRPKRKREYTEEELQRMRERARHAVEVRMRKRSERANDE